MKAYGKSRKATANRKRAGTSMACPCCIVKGANSKQANKAHKAKERKSVMLEGA